LASWSAVPSRSTRSFPSTREDTGARLSWIISPRWERHAISADRVDACRRLSRDRLRLSSDSAAASREPAERGLRPAFSNRDGGRHTGGRAGLGIGGWFVFAGSARFHGHARHQRGSQRVTADGDSLDAAACGDDAGRDAASDGDTDPKSDALSDADGITYPDANPRRVGDAGPDGAAPLGPVHTVPDTVPDGSADGDSAPDPYANAVTESDTGEPDTRNRWDVPDAGTGGTDVLHRNAGLREWRARSRGMRRAQRRDFVSRGQRRAGRVARSRRR
jgi:hypothetical protein